MITTGFTLQKNTHPYFIEKKVQTTKPHPSHHAYLCSPTEIKNKNKNRDEMLKENAVSNLQITNSKIT